MSEELKPVRFRIFYECVICGNEFVPNGHEDVCRVCNKQQKQRKRTPPKRRIRLRDRDFDNT